MPSREVNKEIKKLLKFRNNIERYARRVVIEKLDIITNIIVEKQLHEGRGADGKVVGHYSQATQDYAEEDEMNGYPPRMPKIKGQRYNFDWTGELVENILQSPQVKFDGEGFSIFTLTEKQKLVEEYTGKKLVGLSPKNNEWFNNEILIPELMKMFYNSL